MRATGTVVTVPTVAAYAIFAYRAIRGSQFVRRNAYRLGDVGTNVRRFVGFLAEGGTTCVGWQDAQGNLARLRHVFRGVYLFREGDQGRPFSRRPGTVFRPPTVRVVDREASERHPSRRVRQHAASRAATRCRPIDARFRRTSNCLCHFLQLRSAFRAITRVRFRGGHRVTANDFRRFFRRCVRGARPIFRQASMFVLPIVHMEKGRLTGRVSVSNIGLGDIRADFSDRVSDLSVDAHRFEGFFFPRSTRGNQEMGVRAKEDESEDCSAGILIKRVATVASLCAYYNALVICNINRFTWAKGCKESWPWLTIGEGPTLYRNDVDGHHRTGPTYNCQAIVVRRRL